MIWFVRGHFGSSLPCFERLTFSRLPADTRSSKMKLRPAQSFLGFASLGSGVVCFCVLTLIWQFFAIAICSSSEPVRAFGVVFPPEVQVFCASYAFVGLPVTVAGVISALYGIEKTVCICVFYGVGLLVMHTMLPMYILSANSMCDVLIDERPSRVSQRPSPLLSTSQTGQL